MTDKEIDIFLELLKCARKEEIDQEFLEKISGGNNSDYADGFLLGSMIGNSSIALILCTYLTYRLLKKSK